MSLSKEVIDEFKQIYRREFKKNISDEKARELAQNLIRLFKAVYRDVPPEQLKEIRKSCKKEK